MNKVILMGRLTRDPEVRYTDEQDPKCVAKYTLAVDRKKSGENGPSADFIRCVAFGNNGKFAEKYLHQGIKIAITGRIQTGSYTNKEGQKVYITDIIVEEQEFAESKKSEEGNNGCESTEPEETSEGFMNIPEDAKEDLPFKKK